MSHGTVAIGAIRTRAPFATLFAVEPAKREAIAADIRANGFNAELPIVVWGDTVIDGHTRLLAAGDAGLTEVPIYRRDFADDLAALEYALHHQRDRRNWTPGQMVNAVEVVDQHRRQSHGGDRGNQYTGGMASKDAMPPPVPSTPNADPVRRWSAEETARIVGVSRSTVDRARAIYDDPEAMADVEAGASLLDAATRARERKRAKAEGRAVVRVPVDETAPPFRARESGLILRARAEALASVVAERVALAETHGYDLAATVRADREIKGVWSDALAAANRAVRDLRRIVND